MLDERYTGPLSAGDVSVLNDARIVLREIARTYGSTWSDGMVYAKAETAASALFDLLNTAKHNGGVAHITDDVLHLR